MIYAQVEKNTNKLVMFVGVQHLEFLVAHQEANPDCFFVETNHFGSPSLYAYNSTTGEIEPTEGNNQ